jgi:hypothetical protein
MNNIRPALALVLFFCVAGWCHAQVQPKLQILPQERSKAEINALTDCGARADGVSDDSAALQQCIATHPGRTILFPKSQPSGDCDYKLSQTLSFNTYSTALAGVGGTTNANTTLCWTTDVTGIDITGGLGQSLRNLNLRGNSPFNAVRTDTYPRGSSDGIRVNGGQVSIREVFVSGFSRHGINVDSKLGGGPDLWVFQNVRVQSNRGDGFHISGMDSNAGLCLLCISRLNQGWGFYDDAVIGSTFVAPLTDGNHNDPIKPKVTVPIENITVENGVATVTTTVPHQTIAGDWSVIQGCEKLNNKWPVVAVPSPVTLQINTWFPDGVYCDKHTGTYGFQSGARIWASGRTIGDAATGVHSHNVTSPSAHWSPSDYGTLVCVEGAGPGGSEFCSTVMVVTGNIAILADAASTEVHGGRARIVTNGGPYDSNDSTFVQAYTEGNQEGLSQLNNSLTLGEDRGIGANPEIEHFTVNNGYASPLKFTRLRALPGYNHTVFQAGRALGSGSLARDPSYEGFWNTQEISDRGTLLAALSFRHSNVTGSIASGWNCFSQNPRLDGIALTASSICLPDAQTRVAVNGSPSSTQLPMLPSGGFWVKGSGVEDAVKGTSGLREIRYDAAEAPKTCNPGDIFYKVVPAPGSYVGWICPSTNTPVSFGVIGSNQDSVFGEKVPVPKHAEDPCVPGQWAADSSYYYVCSAKNAWKRAALSAW